MSNLEMFFMIIITLKRIFTVFRFRNKTMKLPMCHNNTFEKYITSFLQNFSIDDQEKFDLLAFKNSKYLFYRFNDFVKMYGNPRYKLLHTRKMLDSKAMEKLEDKNKQFMIEKIIQGVEFENAYQNKNQKRLGQLKVIIELLEEFINNFL